jgi:hypothetical protein
MPEIIYDIQSHTGRVGVNIRAWYKDHHNGVQMYVENKSQINRAKKLLARQLLADKTATDKKVAMMKKNAPD